MTGIELLPLPDSGSGFYEDNVWHDTFSKRQMEAYARDNVAHAVEQWKNSVGRAFDDIRELRQEVAVKDAEIERLRALLLETCDDGDEADADLLATLGRARTAEARAERMAAALRSILYYIEEGGYGFEHTCERVARAALDWEKGIG